MRPTRSYESARTNAEGRLKRFRRGSALAVAITGLALLVTGHSEVPGQDTTGALEPAAVQDTSAGPPDPSESLQEAAGTLQQLAEEFTGILPKVLLAIALIVGAALLVRVARRLLRRVLGRWEQAEAASAMVGVIVWVLAIAMALAVIAGDTRALLGSVGLFGLALSWALQAPIESFAGWLLNSFKRYYRVGDRILVGDVFGDVYRIDALTTTVWEAGGPDKPVQGAQPTGALITFPNSEVLRANIVNHSRGFPFVWDEVTVGLGNESDVAYAMDVVLGVAKRVVGPVMADPIIAYRTILERNGLAYDIAAEPEIYLSPTDSWLDLTVRYLVPVRQRRRWASALQVEITKTLAMSEHGGRIVPAYPTRRVKVSQADS